MKASHIQDIRRRMELTMKALVVFYIIFMIAIPVVKQFVDFKYGHVALAVTIYVAAFCFLFLISDIVLQGVQNKLSNKEKASFFN